MVLSDNAPMHFVGATLVGLGTGYLSWIAAVLASLIFGWTEPWHFLFLRQDDSFYLFPLVGFICSVTLIFAWLEREA
jgi:hypothetical protein